MDKEVRKITGLKGEIEVPGDKSITHRAFILSLIANGETEVEHYSTAADCASTLGIIEKCGAKVEGKTENLVRISSQGIFNIGEPEDVLDAGNSGTTMRLLSGLFSGIEGKLFVLTGDGSLRKRPMKRITEPLLHMGAKIFARENGNYAPVAILGQKLRGINYAMTVASAQVKSAVILAALTASGKTEIIEKGTTRDHTEIMLKEFGGKIEKTQNIITVYPLKEAPKGRKIFVPGDFSSAAYFIAGAAITKESDLLVKNVGVNKTRSYLLKKLQDAGANLKTENARTANGEPVADIRVKNSALSGITVAPEEIPLLIDELPLIAVIGALSTGKTKITGAKELRFKETDRIKATCENLKALGVRCEEFEDGLEVYGQEKVKGGLVDSFGDHRIAMAFSILGLASENGITVRGAECVNISFPEFFDLLGRVSYG